MPSRTLIAEKMAGFLRAISHPYRIRIIEELYAREGEQDVNSLQDMLGTSHSTVSQHLSVLKTHKAVKTRREGNKIFYRLAQSELATWLLHGLAYIEGGLQSEEVIRSAVEEARVIWNYLPDESKKINDHIV